MKPLALESFACPLSKGRLEVVPFEERPVALSDADRERCRRLGVAPEAVATAVKEGVLLCPESRRWYPVVNFVPLLLDYPTGIHHDFVQRHADRASVFAGYSLPDGTPRPGEQFVQRSFTKQWADLPPGKLSFGLTAEQRDEFVRQELTGPAGPVFRPGARVLEVGCGSGFESRSLGRVTGGLVTGIDLNLSLLRNGEALAEEPFLALAVASLFALPARPGSFDLVYSSGVLHHTFSTKAAFDAVCAYRAPHGSVYIWVYAKEDVLHCKRCCVNWIVEDKFRPRLAKMPGWLQNLVIKCLSWRHYRTYRRVGGYNREDWTFADSEHSVRDLWTPLYAHRHSFKEVTSWFQGQGLDCTYLDPDAYLAYFKVPLMGVGVRGVPRAAAPAALLRAA